MSVQSQAVHWSLPAYLDTLTITLQRPALFNDIWLAAPVVAALMRTEAMSVKCDGHEIGQPLGFLVFGRRDS
jgi:hypothetical protein